MRQTLSIAAILFLLPAFLRAPIDHVHVGSLGEHAHASFFHSHDSHGHDLHSGYHSDDLHSDDLHSDDPHDLHASGEHFTDNDSDGSARDVNWFSPVCAPVLNFVAILLPVAYVAPILAGERLFEKIEPRAHDPPSIRFSNPRSPPA